MRIARIQIENIKGIRRIDLRPGSLTKIEGPNGSGKSSIIDAVTCVFQGGSDPGWLRKGAQKGFVLLEIRSDQGGLVATITKTVRLTKSGGIDCSVEILDPNGVAIPAPQTFIARLGESWAIDPGELLSIDASTATGRKALAARLLQIMPIEFAPAELLEAGCPADGIPEGSITLDGLGRARKYVEEMRRKVGVEKKEAEGAVATLAKSLPPDGEEAEDWVAREKELAAARSELQAREAREREEVRHAVQVESEGVRSDFEAEERALREKLQADLAELSVRKQSTLEDLHAIEAERLDRIRQSIGPEFERITSEMTEARERAEQQRKSYAIRESLQQFEEKRRAKLDQYEGLSRTLERLEDLKKTRMDALPIHGVEFSGDQVLINGVPWEHANTAARVTVVAQFCSLAAGKLPFLVLDDAEHMDSETWDAVSAGLVDAGFQVIAAKVSDADGLRVETN